MQKQEKQKTIKNQILEFLSTCTDNVEDLKFGIIEFEVRDGIVYRVKVSNSILIKKNQNS